MELGRKRTLPPGNNFKPEVWYKNNKALIKAGNLKGILGYPTYKLVECILAILGIEDEKILKLVIFELISGGFNKPQFNFQKF